MKVFRSLPTDDGFFSRYATLTPTLYKLGFLAQIVSALTEVGIIYSLVYSGTVDIFPELAPYFAAAGAVIGTAFLEIGLRKFVPFSVRAILYRRFAGLDLAMTIFILLTAVGLLFTSGALSFKGSRSMVEAVAPEAEQRNTAAADSLYQAEKLEAEAAYKADSAAVASRYAAQIEAQRKAYRSKIDVQKTRLDRYRQREEATGKSYATAISYINSKIETLEAERDEKIAVLQEAQAQDFTVVLNRLQAATDEARNQLAEARTEVKAFNKESEAENETKVSRYGYGLAWFTVVCLFVFVLSVTIFEIHHKGSGIEEKAMPTPYHFAPSIFAELRAALNGKWQQFARAKIQGIEERTPPPPLPILPAALYDVGDLRQHRYRLAIEEGDEEERVIYLPRPTQRGNAGAADLERLALDYYAASVELEEKNYHAAARELELKADHVIKAYLGPDATPANVVALKGAIRKHIFEGGPNPFQHHHRREIGFKKSAIRNSFICHCQDCGEAFECSQPGAAVCAECEAAAVEEALNNRGQKKGGEKEAHNGPVNTPSNALLGNCDNCGKEYQKRAMNQRFCCTDCRLEFHAQKHGGKKFKPIYRKGKK